MQHLLRNEVIRGIDKRSYDSIFIIRHRVVPDRLTRHSSWLSLGCLVSSPFTPALHRAYHRLGTNEKIGRNCLVLYRVPDHASFRGERTDVRKFSEEARVEDIESSRCAR